MVKALIFDLDGVVVSTEWNHYIAWKSIAQELGIPFSENDNERLKGISRKDSLKRMLEMGGKNLDDSEFNIYLDKKNKRYLDSIGLLDQSNVLPGVISVLKKASSLGLKTAIGSSSKNARFILSKLELSSFFDVIVDGNDVDVPKPDPEVFLKGAERLGVRPHETIVFEDALSGIQAAKEGGFIAVGVGNEHLREIADEYYTNLTEFSLMNYA
jgi:beta-phosphoglucomutase